jgi:hypothetical protein
VIDHNRAGVREQTTSGHGQEDHPFIMHVHRQ